MKRSKIEIAEGIKADEELRPYFIDYLGENLKMTFGRSLDENGSLNQRFTEGADSKLAALMWKLESRVPKRYVDFVLHEVCEHYANMPIALRENKEVATRLVAFTF